MKEKLYIGLDLGGTALKYGLVAENGELLEHNQAKSYADKGKDVVFNVINNSVAELIEKANSRNAEVIAVGLGTPGNVNIENGELMNIPPTFKKWGKINIKNMLEDKFKLPFF